MTEEATIRRGPRNARYTTVPNHVFEDTKLSMEARWLLGYLLSKPDGWIVRLSDIRKKGGCGRDKARAMVAELVDERYAEREEARKDGKFNGLSLVIYDEPRALDAPIAEVSTEAESDTVASLPQTEKPATVKPATVNPPLVKTEDLATPESSIERERGREEDGQESQTPAPHDRPGSAEFEKRVARLCNGTGYLAGAWHDWDTASFGWIAGRFAALTPEERAEAERWRDAYLLDIRDRKAKPQPIGVFLRDKAWTALDPDILDRAEKMRQARLKPEEHAKPEGWAPCLGPVGMARFFAFLAEGPREGLGEPPAVVGDAQLRAVWPGVADWQALLRQKGGVVFGPRWHALKLAMEPVPKDSEVLGLWRQTFRDRGWPWLAPFDRVEALYCPKGGPDGMDVFQEALSGGAAKRDEKEQALRGETLRQAQDEGNTDDAGRPEAAE